MQSGLTTTRPRNYHVTNRGTYVFLVLFMKRPLIPVALCYLGGLLLGEAVPVPLFSLFTISFGLILAAIFLAHLRNRLLWPLLVLIGWTNLTQHTAIIAPHDLRILIGHEPRIATLRGTLIETPSVRVHERQGQGFARTLVPLRVTALATNDGWQPAFGNIVVTTKGELPADIFAGREVEISGVLTPPPKPIAPGLFDYRTFLARQGIHYQLKADSLRTGARLTPTPTNLSPTVF
jgi:hypothetical protein